MKTIEITCDVCGAKAAGYNVAVGMVEPVLVAELRGGIAYHLCAGCEGELHTFLAELKKLAKVQEAPLWWELFHKSANAGEHERISFAHESPTISGAQGAVTPFGGL